MPVTVETNQSETWIPMLTSFVVTVAQLIFSVANDPVFTTEAPRQDAVKEASIPETTLAATRLFFDALKSPDTTAEQLRDLVRQGAIPSLDPRAVGMRGMQPMFRAATRVRDPEVFSLLISAGIPVRDGDVKRAASSNSSLEALQVLYQAWVATREVGTKQDLDLIGGAASNPNAEIMRWALAENRTGVNSKYGDGLTATPLVIAASRNPNPEVSRLLIKAGADLNPPKTLTPLMAACRNNTNIEVVRALLEAGADVNAAIIGQTPYLYAAMRGSIPEAFSLLVSYGANPNPRLRIGKTFTGPLELILGYNDHPGMLAAAIAAGSRPLRPNFANDLEDADVVEITRVLVDSKIDINRGMPYPLTSHALRGQNPGVVSLLLNQGADVDHRLAWTAFTESPALIQSSTPLMAAAISQGPKAMEIMSMLIENGADLDAQDKTGSTALIRAATRESEDVQLTYALIRTLLEAGADPNLPNRDGATAKDIAQRNKLLVEAEIERLFRMEQGTR